MAFARLVQDEREPLEAYVRTLGASPEDAEELAASALLVAYRAWAMHAMRRTATREELRDIALTLWRQLERRQRRSEPPEGLAEPPPVVADATQQVEIAEDAHSLLVGISRLPATQRRALYLREIRGLSYAEIAEELSASVPAVESALHRARQTLGRFGGPRLLRGLVFAPLLGLRRGLDHAVDVATQLTAARLAVPAAIVLATGGLTVGTTHEPIGGAPGSVPAAVAQGGRLSPPASPHRAGAVLRAPRWAALPAVGLRVAQAAQSEGRERSEAAAMRPARAADVEQAAGVVAGGRAAAAPAATAHPPSESRSHGVAPTSSALRPAVSDSGTLAVPGAGATRTDAGRRVHVRGRVAILGLPLGSARYGVRTAAGSGRGIVHGRRQRGPGGHRHRGSGSAP